MGNPRGEFTWRHVFAIVLIYVSLSWVADGCSGGALHVSKLLGVGELGGTLLLLASGVGGAFFAVRALGRRAAHGGAVDLPVEHEKTDLIVILEPLRDEAGLADARSVAALEQVRGWGSAFRAVHEHRDWLKRLWVLFAAPQTVEGVAVARANVERFGAVVCGGLLLPEGRDVEVYLLRIDSVVDFRAAQDHVERVFDTFGDRWVTLDVTGGTKPMSIGALLGALDAGRQVTYVDSTLQPPRYLAFRTSRDLVVRADE